MADFKGQKIRYPGGEGFARAFKGLGINGVAMPYTEVDSALQNHMIDGVMTDMLSWQYFQMERYCPIVNKIPVSITPICWIVNTEWWESLDPKVRAALASPFERVDLTGFYAGLQEKNTQQWRDDPKLTVVEFNPDEAALWNKAMREAAKETISGIEAKYLEAVEKTKKQISPSQTPRRIGFQGAGGECGIREQPADARGNLPPRRGGGGPWNDRKRPLR